MKPNEDLWKRGDTIRTSLLGEAMTNKLNQAGTYDHPMMELFGDYIREAVYGMVFDRPALDLKTRILLCVVTSTATHAMQELSMHLRSARRMGWTEEELGEVLLQLGVYLGIPVGRKAMLVAKQVFEDYNKELAAGG